MPIIPNTAPNTNNSTKSKSTPITNNINVINVKLPWMIKPKNKNNKAKSAIIPEKLILRE
ncbi:hypothetical protein JPSP3_01100 [Staphylococcus pseudintermedius]